MHEAAITAALIEMAASRCPESALIREVWVKVGLLTGVSPDALSFYFDALAPERLGPQARLCARLEPLRGGCRACGRRIESAGRDWVCPGCGAAALVFDNGDELDLVSLLVDDIVPTAQEVRTP